MVRKSVVISNHSGKVEDDNTHPCATPGCQGKVGAGSITGLCKRCYSSIYHWKKRPIKHLIKRSGNIRLYAARMNFLLPTAELEDLDIAPKFTPLVVLPGDVKQYKKRPKQYKIMRKRSSG